MFASSIANFRSRFSQKIKNRREDRWRRVNRSQNLGAALSAANEVSAGDPHARERNGDRPMLEVATHQNASILAQFSRIVMLDSFIFAVLRQNVVRTENRATTRLSPTIQS